MARELKNIGASVRIRLLQLAKASGQSFDLVLTRLALDRLLFWLSQLPHAGRFVLKGAISDRMRDRSASTWARASRAVAIGVTVGSGI